MSSATSGARHQLTEAVFIGVYAYGESRFELTFDPCSANIASLCPMNSSVPIEANGVIPVSQAEVALIPSIALTIPDFEGQAILRVFANSTQSQIGCVSAVITNGATFSHPGPVGGTLGAFTIIALVSSAATAIYGQSVPETRNHYAHSVSVLAVFAVFHHIFFTGGLSMNWPSVLVAFWSNYAWAGGMIYSTSMQTTINNFIGSNKGNISTVGSAPSGQNAPNLGGGYQISQIYKRDLANSSTGFQWYGKPVQAGLPLPGNYSGFAGTLAEMNIPASNAFLTGFLWFLVLVALMAASVVLCKWCVEGLSRFSLIKTERLAHFRRQWIRYTVAVVLRTCFIAFFMMAFLTMFQFTLGGSAGVQGLAGVVLVAFLLGLFGVAAYALYYRLRHDRVLFRSQIKQEYNERVPKAGDSAEASEKGEDDGLRRMPVSQRWWRIHLAGTESERPHVHDDENYTMRFGWLASRFRRSRWWFFAFWLVYELVRAAFYGGAAGHPLTQVFGLLAWETIALVAIVVLKPFESNRLNLLVVYFLGFSKVVTVALSSAFDDRFGLSRLLTTVIGIVIIVIQGILTISLMIAIVLGAISSYMSVTRYHEEFKPKSWQGYRTRYFRHMDQKATDKPAPPPPPPPPEPEHPKEPYFLVTTVRRQPKIEDDDDDDDDVEGTDDGVGHRASTASMEQVGSRAPSRTMSMRSKTSVSNLPYGARRHRTSWSTKDFMDHEHELRSGKQSRMSLEDAQDVTGRNRTVSLTGPSPQRNSWSMHEAGLAMRDGSESLQTKPRHRRTISTPHRNSKRDSSVVAEEGENDIIRPAT